MRVIGFNRFPGVRLSPYTYPALIIVLIVSSGGSLMFLNAVKMFGTCWSTE